METTFIYGLYDPVTGQLRYIGKSNNPQTRLNGHIYKAAHYTNENTYILNWIRKLLKSGKRPRLEILEEVSRDKWQEAEKNWIKTCKTLGCDLTNITEGGDAPEMTKESIMKMSESKKGKKASEETRRKIGLKSLGRKPWLGKSHTEETKKKISDSNKGKKLSEEHKRKVSEGLRGRPVSEETRRKIAMSNSTTNRGRKLSEEHKQKISEGLRRSKVFAEAKEKMSKSAKIAWGKRRANK